MAKIIAFTNQKGGVGKTTAAVCVAAGLKVRGFNSLLIDMDSQGNASAASGLIIEDGRPTVKNLLTDGGHPKDYITSTAALDIIPSNNALKDIEDELIKGKRFDLLRDVLKPIKKAYDYIIIDCPPSINVFTKNALAAADEIVIPVDLGYFSLLGLKQLLEEIDHIKEHLNPRIKIKGILACKYDRRTSLSEQVLEILRHNFPGRVFNTVIKVNVEIVRSQIAQKNIFEYSPKGIAAQNFLCLVEELTSG
jgi:chromosome partitioning protein